MAHDGNVEPRHAFLEIRNDLLNAPFGKDEEWGECLKSFIAKQHPKVEMDMALKRLQAYYYKVLCWLGWCTVKWCNPADTPKSVVKLAAVLKARADAGPEGKPDSLPPALKNGVKMDAYEAMARKSMTTRGCNASCMPMRECNSSEVVPEVINCLLEEWQGGIDIQPSKVAVHAARAFSANLQAFKCKASDSDFGNFAKVWWNTSIEWRSDDMRRPLQQLLRITMRLTARDRDDFASTFGAILDWLAKWHAGTLLEAVGALSASTDAEVVAQLSEGFLEPAGPEVLLLGLKLRGCIGDKVKLTSDAHLAALLPPVPGTGEIVNSDNAAFLMASCLWQLGGPLSRAASSLLCKLLGRAQGLPELDDLQGKNILSAMKVSVFHHQQKICWDACCCLERPAAPVPL